MKAQIREAYERLKAGVPDFASLKLLVQAATKSDEELMDDPEVRETADEAAVRLALLVSYWGAP